jgi:carbon-monoxide dehydrogenase medium subunit
MIRPFALQEPENVDEAVAALASGDTRPLAGGAALVLAMSQGLFRPSQLVWLGRCAELTRLRRDDAGVLHIGATVRHAQAAADPLVRAHAPLLADATVAVGDPQIRNMASLGGNLCHADPQSDPPAALLALDAAVVLRSRGGERRLPVGTFMRDAYETMIEPGELLTEIVIPPPKPGLRAVYARHLAGPADDRPLVSLAITASVENGRCAETAIAVGAAASRPTRAAAAEARLRGESVNAALCREAAALAVRDLDVIDDLRAAGEYRRAVTEVLVRRTLAKLFGVAGAAA